MSEIDTKAYADDLRHAHHELARLRYEFAKHQVAYHHEPTETHWRAFASSLRDLSVQLLIHFRDEEAPGGFMDLVSKRDPSQLKAVEELLEEHETMRSILGRLGEHIRGPRLRPKAFSELAHEIKNLFLILREHDSIENRMIYALYRPEMGEAA